MLGKNRESAHDTANVCWNSGKVAWARGVRGAGKGGHGSPAPPPPAALPLTRGCMALRPFWSLELSTLLVEAKSCHSKDNQTVPQLVIAGTVIEHQGPG